MSSSLLTGAHRWMLLRPLALALLSLATTAEASRKPPMGWNSWDCFQGNLNETGALEVAAAIKQYLLPSGYDSLTVRAARAAQLSLRSHRPADTQAA